MPILKKHHLEKVEALEKVRRKESVKKVIALLDDAILKRTEKSFCIYVCYNDVPDIQMARLIVEEYTKAGWTVTITAVNLDNNSDYSFYFHFS